MSDKTATLANSFEILEKKLGIIESDLVQSRERYLADISTKLNGVSRDVLSIQEQLEECTDTRLREQQKHSEAIHQSNFTSENFLRSDRLSFESKLKILKDIVLEYKTMRDTGDTRFHSFVLQEIAELKNNIIIESESRENADEDIIAALNHYTKDLQSALKLINNYNVFVSVIIIL